MVPEIASPCSPAHSFRVDRLAALADVDRRHFWFAGRTELVRRLVPETLVRGRDVLDVGCGTGSMLAELTRRGAHATGVDALPQAVAMAAYRCPTARVLEAGADALPFKARSFDGVTMLDVLEHVDETRALTEIRRVLRPGGWLLVTVPAGAWLWSYRDDDAGHLRRYSRTRLEGALAGAGLVVERFTRYQCLLFPLVVASRLAGRSSSRSRDREESVSGSLNTMLSFVNRHEGRLAARVTLPWGSSLVALARAAP
jgi:SAM-dependent methyltransferase